MTHRERLISLGLMGQISDGEICRRNEILFRMQKGEKIKDVPVWCVYRRDEPLRQVILSGKDECRDAELIADKLYSYEAHVLVDKLNYKDPEQPPRKNPHLPQIGMYGVCTMEDWTAWEMRNSQMKLEEEKENG